MSTDMTAENNFRVWALWHPVGSVIWEVSEGRYWRTTAAHELEACDAPPAGIAVITADKTRL